MSGIVPRSTGVALHTLRALPPAAQMGTFGSRVDVNPIPPLGYWASSLPRS
jgi:hypothetical protein